MKTNTVLTLLCMICFGGFFLWSCEPVQSYSEIPEIHFKKLAFENKWDTLDNVFVNTPVLSFSFMDGDGDLGVRPQDLKKPDGADNPDGRVSRIHYTWLYIVSGDTVSYQFANGAVQSSEIPYKSVMDKSEAQNRTLKGTIEMALSKPNNPPGIDVMHVKFYIVDRAKNQSNIEYIPDFSILSEVGTEITK